MGQNLPPSRFGAGYTYGGNSEPEPPPESATDSQRPNSLYGYSSASTGGTQTGFPTPSGSFGYASQQSNLTPISGHRDSSKIAILVIVAVTVLTGGGFLAGHFVTSSKRTQASNGNSAPGGRPGDAVTPAQFSTEIAVPDSATDAVPHPVDGQVYGPSDIVEVSVRSNGANLIITTEFTPSTPMNIIATATRVRLNPEVVPSCKDSVLDSFDWSIEYDIDGLTVFRTAQNCEDRYQPTQISGSASIAGSTLTLEVAEASLGIRPGQKIQVRTCVSTRIDAESTTFIQDWAPDNPSGAIGNI